MHTDIGLRNHRASQIQGLKVVEKWIESKNPALRQMAASYKDALVQSDALFTAANILENR